MEISYIGHSSFLLKTKDCRVVTDPFAPETGLKFPKTTANIITVSHHHRDHDYVEGVTPADVSAKDESINPMIFDWPGEFEKNGVRIFGYQSFHDTKEGAERGENTIFTFEVEGLNIVHLGDLGHIPDEKLTEAIGNVDILFIPVGGFFSLEPKQAADTIKKLDPAIVIPMHYANEKLAPEIGEKLKPLSEFLKVMGVDNVQPLDKYVVKKDELAEKENEIVVLNPMA